ncbi:MAG: MucB/RseB C-terminal domain-containing protein [Lysobacterales bacterium]
MCAKVLMLGAMLVLVPLLAQAAGSDDWHAWAVRMDKAQQSLNYDATMVIDVGDNNWDLVELSQRVGPGGPEQQWVSLNGAGRRQLRTSQGISVLGPEGDQRIGRGAQLRLGEASEQLASSYRISMDGSDRVAGRQAVRMILQPLQPDRYGLHLWIDADTGLPLRSERIGNNGVMLERRMVTRLTVRGFAGGRAQVPPLDSAQLPGWSLPSGFRLVGTALAVPGLAGARQWVISDGVAWVSVYQMTLPSGLTLDKNGWRHGAMSQITVRNGDHWFYVLGDLPPETLMRVGQAAIAAEP